MTQHLDSTPTERLLELEEREQQFRYFVETAPDAILVIDGADLLVKLANERAEEMFRYAREELIGRPGQLLIPERLRDAFFARPDVSSSVVGSQRAITLRGLRSDGTEFPVEINRSVLRTRSGTTIFLIVHDVSERHEMQQALEHSEERFRRIIEGLKDEYAFYSRDMNPDRPEHLGLLDYISPSCEKLLGYTQEEMRARQVEFTDHPMNAAVAELYARTMAGERIPAYECEIRHKDGSGRVFELLETPFLDEQGRVMTLDGVAHDVTKQHATREMLEEARKAAESANQAKSAFLANMSHELRTPLNAILGYSEMLMEEAEDDGLDGYVGDLRKIHQSGTHLLGLINDVLDIAKIEAGKMDVIAETFGVDRLLDEVCATAAPLIAKNDNTLTVERDGDLGSAKQDITKLRQSLLNLLSNAAKFTKAGTVTVSASRTALDGADWLEIAVADDGIGIPQDKLATVFEEFGQAQSTTSRDYGGTGLGLPISRRFCRLLGGDLLVSSKPGEGAVFTIRLPAELSDSD